jgi:hypothetical protein
VWSSVIELRISAPVGAVGRVRRGREPFVDTPGYSIEAFDLSHLDEVLARAGEV